MSGSFASAYGYAIHSIWTVYTIQSFDSYKISFVRFSVKFADGIELLTTRRGVIRSVLSRWWCCRDIATATKIHFLCLGQQQARQLSKE